MPPPCGDEAPLAPCRSARIGAERTVESTPTPYKEFLTEEAFKATIIGGFFTGSKTYTAFYYSSHDEDCMIITALLLAE